MKDEWSRSRRLAVEAIGSLIASCSGFLTMFPFIPHLVLQSDGELVIAGIGPSVDGIPGTPRNLSSRTPTINALDYYGLWKLFDALCDAAFYSKNREFALGNTPLQRFMGKWSDGVPVKELFVTDRP